MTVLTNVVADGTNPWLSMWRDACTECGVRLVALGGRSLVVARRRLPQGIHLQWPEHVLGERSALRAVRRGGKLLGQVALARARGLPVLLTMHNTASHQGNHAILEKHFWVLLSRMVTDVHVLSAAGQQDVVAEHPGLARSRWHVIPHGTYEPVLPPLLNRDEAREFVGLPPRKLVALTFGALRPYKGVEELLDVLEERPPGEDRLMVVAGRPGTEEVGRRLEEASAKRKDVLLQLEFLPFQELVQWISACDVVVLPYRRVLNSGSAMLALTCHRPVLLPASPTFDALSEDVGEGWVTTYRGRLRLEHVWGAAAADRPAAPNLTAHDWGDVRARISQMYSDVFG